MRLHPLELALLAGAMAGGVVLGGCRVIRPNPDHCYHAQGDLTCAELDPSTPYCAGPGCSDHPDGCVADLPPDECYNPCGQDRLFGEDASCIEMGEESGTEAGTESGTSTETGEGECRAHADCPDEAAYCFSGTCVSCDDAPNPTAACFELTEGQATVCLNGACVECTPDEAESCAEAELVCDPETYACVPCSAHDQCAGGAGCDLALGKCLPPDAVWHVDGDGGQDFETIAEALAALGNGSGTIIIHAVDDPGYIEGVSFSGDRALAVLGAEGELPLLYMTPVSLEVLDGARVYASRLVLNGDDAALVADAHLELDTVRVAPVLTHCVMVESGRLRMRNSMLRSALSAAPAVDVSGVSELDIRYSTLIGMGAIAAIECQGATIVPGSRIRNSILVNFGDSPAVECASPAYEDNGLEDADGFAGNTTLGDVQPDWFVDTLSADLHLGLGAPLGVADAAVWSEGDPVVDFDGDRRPAVEGSPDFVGADRVP